MEISLAVIPELPPEILKASLSLESTTTSPLGRFNWEPPLISRALRPVGSSTRMPLGLRIFLAVAAAQMCMVLIPMTRAKVRDTSRQAVTCTRLDGEMELSDLVYGVVTDTLSRSIL